MWSLHYEKQCNYFQDFLRITFYFSRLFAYRCSFLHFISYIFIISITYLRDKFVINLNNHCSFLHFIFYIFIIYIHFLKR